MPETSCKIKENSCCQAKVTDQHLGQNPVRKTSDPCELDKSCHLCVCSQILAREHSVLARVALSWRKNLSLFAQLIAKEPDLLFTLYDCPLG